MKKGSMPEFSQKNLTAIVLKNLFNTVHSRWESSLTLYL